jgi:GT2 family glycosyltransferase
VVSILIVNWNTREFLHACLSSLQATCSEIEHEVIVVDNASNDGSADMVATEFPDVILLAQMQNLGFAAGNNLAFDNAKGDWIWLLNPDTAVLDGALSNLVVFLKKKPKAGAVASALIDARTGKVQRSCRTFPTPAALWVQSLGLACAFSRSKRFGFYKMGWWNYRDERQVEQPMASSFLLRRAAIGTSGGLFDENFPIFFNDVDLCWRLKLAGWEIWFTPNARVKHWGGGATSQIRPTMIRESHASLRRFYEKWLRIETSALIYWPTVAMFEFAGLIRSRLHGPS